MSDAQAGKEISITPCYGRQMTLWEEQRAACLTVKRAKCQWGRRRRRGSCCAAVTAGRPRRGVEGLIKPPWKPAWKRLEASSGSPTTAAYWCRQTQGVRPREASLPRCFHVLIAASSPSFSPFCFFVFCHDSSKYLCLNSSLSLIPTGLCSEYRWFNCSLLIPHWLNKSKQLMTLWFIFWMERH